MGFLCSLCLAPFVAHLRIFLSVVLADELLRGIEGEGREVGRVGTHICDESVLIELLGYVHCLADREPELACSLLLKGRSSEWGGWETVAFLLVYLADSELGANASCKEFLCGFHVREASVESSFYKCLLWSSFRMEDCFHFIISLLVEGKNLSFSVHDEPESYRLYTSG